MSELSCACDLFSATSSCGQNGSRKGLTHKWHAREIMRYIIFLCFGRGKAFPKTCTNCSQRRNIMCSKVLIAVYLAQFLVITVLGTDNFTSTEPTLAHKACVEDKHCGWLVSGKCIDGRCCMPFESCNWKIQEIAMNDKKLSMATPALGEIHYPKQNAPPPGSRSESPNVTVHDFKLPEGSCYRHEDCNSTSECDKIDKSMTPGHCKLCEKIFEGAYYCPSRKPHIVFCPQNSTIGTLPGFGSGLPIKGHVSGHLDFSFEFGQGVGQSNCDTKPNCNAPVEKPKCDVSDILKILGVVKPACQPEAVPSDPSGNVDFKTLCELARLNDQIRLALGEAYKLQCENGSQTESPLPTLPSINPTILNPLNITASSSKHSRPTRFPAVLPSETTRKPRQQNTDYPFFSPSQNANPPGLNATDYPFFSPSQNANPPGLNATDYPFFTPSQNANPPAHSNKSTHRKHHTTRPPRVNVSRRFTFPAQDVTPFSPGRHQSTSKRSHPGSIPPGRVQTSRTPPVNPHKPPVHPHKTTKVHVKTIRPHTATQHHHRRTTPKAQYTDYRSFTPSQNANPPGHENTDYPYFTPSQNANPPGHENTDYPYFTPSQNANPSGHENTDYPYFTPSQNANPPGHENTDYPYFTPSQNANPPELQYTDYPNFSPSQNAHPPGRQKTGFSIFTPSQNAERSTPPVHSRRTPKTRATRPPRLPTRETRQTPEHHRISTVVPEVTPKVRKTGPPHVHPRVSTPERFFTSPSHAHKTRSTSGHSQKTHSTRKHRPTQPPQEQHVTIPKLKTQPPSILNPTPRRNKPLTNQTIGFEVTTPKVPEERHIEEQTTPSRNNPPTAGYETVTPKKKKIVTPKGKTSVSRRNEPITDHTAGYEVTTPKASEGPKKHPRKPKTSKKPPSPHEIEPTTDHSVSHKIRTPKVSKVTNKPASPRRNEPSTSGYEIITPKDHKKSSKHPKPSRGPKTPESRNIEPSTSGYEVITPKDHKKSSKRPKPSRHPKTPESRNDEPSTAGYEIITPENHKKSSKHPKPSRHPKTPESRNNEPSTVHYKTKTSKKTRATAKHLTPHVNEPEVTTPQAPRTPKKHQTTTHPSRASKPTPGPNRTPKHDIHTPKLPKVSKAPKPKPTHPTPDNRNGHNDGPASTPAVTVWPKFTPTTESGEVTKRKKHEKIKLEMSVSVESGPRTRPPDTAELFGEERHHVTHRTRKPKHKKTQQAAMFSSDIDSEEEHKEKEQLTTQGPPKKPRQKAFAMYSSDIEADEDTQDEKQSTTPKAPKKVGAKKSKTTEKPKSPSPGLHERPKSLERGWGESLATQTVRSIDLATQTVKEQSVTAKPVKPKTNSKPKKSKSILRGGLKTLNPAAETTLAPGEERIRETDRASGELLATQTVHGIDLATQTVQSVTNPPAKVKSVSQKKPKAARKSIRHDGLETPKPTAGPTLAPGRVEIRETELPKDPQANALKKSNKKPAGIKAFSFNSAPEVSGGLTQGPPRSGSGTTEVQPDVKSGRRSLKKSNGKHSGDKTSDRALVQPGVVPAHTTTAPRKPESGTTQLKPEAKNLKEFSGKSAGVNTFGRRALPPSPASSGHVTFLPERSESRSTHLDPKDRKVTPGGSLARKSTTENPLKRKSAELIREGIEELISSDEKQPIKCNPKANNGNGDCPSTHRCYPPFPKSSFGYCYENEEFSPAEEKVSKSNSASGELKDGPSSRS
ncbi:hypothetical protein DdX_10243 [Ditylenchus destructor]|uniref:Uncharacterized protein n=1 Tax=Ditylenchus destructor TaxID=166010 RepID=A0AAD4R5F3_9BILA|nr:hypothetical protein DdX_10243 [Ditylenchus destructor]